MSVEAETTATETTTAETVAAETTLVTDTSAETTTEETTEATTTEETTEETTSEETEETTAEGAPEEYAEFAMPEGIELDTELADQFKTVAKDLNLNQEQAQKVVDLAGQMRQRDVEAIIAVRQEWLDESKADPEFGGDKLDASLGVAKKAISAYGSEKFVELLNQTGFGNHPEFIRFAVKAGKGVAEDTVVTGGTRAATPNQSFADRIYGKK